MAGSLSIRLKGVCKSFAPSGRGDPPVAALHDIALELAPGRLMGLVGPDGAGKTTLLRILAGLVEADEGEIEVLGAPVSCIDRAKIGYMPQGGALYAELSVKRNLELYARLRGFEPAGNPERMEQVYRLTGLADFREREAGRLSGGMRQKLALACAVVAAPPLMLLDEPSVGVDPLSRREIWELARTLAGPESCIVWATSILDDAERCDDVAVLHQGTMRYCGPAKGFAGLARGHVFIRTAGQSESRTLQREVVLHPGVVAGGVEGEGVRILLRQGAGKPQGRWVPASPRADDGFALLLDDGEPLKPSAIAEVFPDRTAMRGTAIESMGLTKRYGDFTAAEGMTFSVAPGEVFGLLGPNGAGKSTTFRMLCGLITPSAGSGRVAGHDLRRARSQARQAMGYMPQKFSLYGDLSVRANLRFVGGAYGLAGTALEQAMANAVEALDLESYLDRPAGLLPLGVRQRLSLAAAVLHRPEVLFLDEPTSGVDPLVRREFWHHINAIAAKGVAVLVTTHFMDEAENCDRLLLINQAQPIASGTPAQLRESHAGRPDATLEEAFVALIEEQRRNRQAA